MLKHWDERVAGLSDAELEHRLWLARTRETDSAAKGQGRSPKAAREWRHRRRLVEEELARRADERAGLEDKLASLPVLVIDGERFTDVAGFIDEISGLLVDFTWNGSLDAFDDILSGGCGTPDGGFVLRWEHSEESRLALGADRFDQIVEILRRHAPGPDRWGGIVLQLA